MADIFMKQAEASPFFTPSRVFWITTAVLCASFFPRQTMAQTPGPAACRIESRDFEGWHAQEMSNPWVKVTIVPQLGARVMQVTLTRHAFLFLHPNSKSNSIHPTPQHTTRL